MVARRSDTRYARLSGSSRPARCGATFCAVVSSDECRTPIRAEALASVEHPEVVANTLRCTRKRRSQAWAPARVELRRLDDLDRTVGCWNDSTRSPRGRASVSVWLPDTRYGRTGCRTRTVVLLRAQRKGERHGQDPDARRRCGRVP